MICPQCKQKELALVFAWPEKVTCTKCGYFANRPAGYIDIKQESVL